MTPSVRGLLGLLRGLFRRLLSGLLGALLRSLLGRLFRSLLGALLSSLLRGLPASLLRRGLVGLQLLDDLAVDQALRLDAEHAHQGHAVQEVLGIGGNDPLGGESGFHRYGVLRRGASWTIVCDLWGHWHPLSRKLLNWRWALTVNQKLVAWYRAYSTLISPGRVRSPQLDRRRR